MPRPTRTRPAVFHSHHPISIALSTGVGETHQHPRTNGARFLDADALRLLEDPALVDEKGLLERREGVQANGHAAVDVVADAELGAVGRGGEDDPGGVAAEDGGEGFDEEAGVVHEWLAGGGDVV